MFNTTWKRSWWVKNLCRNICRVNSNHYWSDVLITFRLFYSLKHVRFHLRAAGGWLLQRALSRWFFFLKKRWGLQRWLSAVAHVRNSPITSREICQVKCWRKGLGNCDSFSAISQANSVRTWTSQSEMLSSWWYHNDLIFQLHFNSIVNFTKTGPLFEGFRCCKCVFALLNFRSNARDSVRVLKLLRVITLYFWYFSSHSA